ncbi:hypothetical protein [Alloalcanivorax dieselolei]|nr:hypothetical protein [Alloalcanivorax dieselolei]
MALAACGGSSSGDSSSSPLSPEEGSPQPEQPSPSEPPEEEELPEGGPLLGAVQKGPFQAGAKVTLVPLRHGVPVEGARELETTVDERGRYTFSGTGLEGPALLRASGYWFDERSGQYSGEPVTLRAVVNVADGEANVNVLTDLISERLQKALADNDDDYPTALSSVMADYRELTGLNQPPGLLDMLKGFIQGETLDVGYYQESRLLPLIAAAAAESAMPGLAEARSGFAIDGADNESARAFWEAMWEGYASLVAEHHDETTLLEHLQAQLNGQYPLAAGETFAPAVLGGMRSVLVGNAPSCSQGPNGSNDDFNRQICPGAGAQDVLVGEEYGAAGFYLDAPAAASYVVRLRVPHTPDNRKIVLEYTPSGRVGYGDIAEQCSGYDACDVGTRALREGERVFFRIRTTGKARTVQVLAERLGDGHPVQPMVIHPNRAPYRGWAGSKDGSAFSQSAYSGTANVNSYAHYLFYVGSGRRTLLVDDFVCGGVPSPLGHRMHLFLAKMTSKGYVAVMNDSTYSCDGLRHEIGGGETGVYYLRVHPDYYGTASGHSATLRYDFRIQLQPWSATGPE